MKTVSPTELRGNIYKLLDEILNSGVPIEINKGGNLLRIVPVVKSSKLQNLISGGVFSVVRTIKFNCINN